MKKLILSIVACACTLFANAQSEEYISYPFDFITVQGGGQTIKLSENSGDMKFSPLAALSFGMHFNPYIGARLNFQGAWNTLSMKGGDTFNYNSITTSLDGMLNLTNCFRDDEYKPLNLYLIGGVGVVAPWNTSGTYSPLTEDIMNYRGGLQLDYRLTRITSVNLELDANYLRGSEMENFGKGKWKFGALVGLTFRLPSAADMEKYYSLKAKNNGQDLATIAKQEAEAEQARAEAAKAEAARAAAAAAAAKAAAAKAAAAKKLAAEQAATAAKAKAEAEAAAAKINETIFFAIGKTTTAENFDAVVNATAEWCKKFPNKVATIDAYADKGTGTAKQNAIVAKRRATAVANAVKAKGIAADQLAVSSHGDKVQPFAENDQNRCVIIVGK